MTIKTGRLGFHHGFAPHTDVIASWIYSDAEYGFNVKPFFEAEVEDKGYIGELQFMHRVKSLRLTTGAGYLNADRETAFVVPDFFSLRTESDIEHYFGYIYTLIDLPASVTWTLGLNAGKWRGLKDDEQLNPKLGVTWRMLESTTLRAAAFRVLEDLFLAKQRLEPTHIAGFNQVYEEVLDGSETVDAWNYGMGIDHKFSETISAGIEYVERDLDVPFVDVFGGGSVEEVDWEEKTTRLYLYAAPWDQLALSMGYQYEEFRRDSIFTGDEDFAELDTHRTWLDARLFLPAGFYTGAKATYVDQEGLLGSQDSGLRPGQDNFWVLDAEIGWRLPRRWGTINLKAWNILDEAFRFQDTDPVRPTIYPDPTIVVKLTLTL